MAPTPSAKQGMFKHPYHRNKSFLSEQTTGSATAKPTNRNKRRFLTRKVQLLDGELSLKHYGLHFISETTESDYRKWRGEQNLPLMRIAILAGLMSWVLGLVLIYIWSAAHFERVFLNITLLIIPAFLFGIALIFSANGRKWALPIVISLQVISACEIVLQYYPIGNSPGGAVAWSIYAALYAPLMRLPPRAAIIAILPSSILVQLLMIHAWQNDNISALDAQAYTSAPFTTFIFVVIVCLAIERLSRQAFIKDQVIDQKNLSLERSQDLIRRYVPHAVAEQITTNEKNTIDQPKRERITVLFSDIVGFTDMADRIDAEALTQVLNEYMATMAEIVEAHNGTLNEFIGDGIMALFGAPAKLPPEYQAKQAVRTAQAMQAALPALNKQWLKLGIGQALQIRIGINTGMLSVGSFGSAGRMTYTAIGLQTNIAARIQAQCQPGGILLSENSWHLVKDQIPCEPKGTTKLKGVHFPVTVYQPI